MKTEKEVKKLLLEKKAELKTYGKAVTIKENPLVALLQCSLEGQIHILNQILNP